jgi:predicted nucleotidyltransferase
VLAPQVRRATDQYLRAVDRTLPGRIAGFYLVGSVALGDFQPGRSDVDFVAVVTQRLDPVELRLLNTMQRLLYLQSLVDAVPHFRWPRVCNGVFVERESVRKSALQVTPIASHVAGKFTPGGGFDANPVTWLNLKRYGVRIRGPEPAELDIYHSDSELRAWTLGNLNSYWRRWTEDIQRPGLTATKALLLRYVAWGVQGTSRMHYTVVTGDLASKTRATDYALDMFPLWRPLIEEVRAYWRGPVGLSRNPSPFRRSRNLAAFMKCVIDSAAATGWRPGAVSG